MRTRLVTLLVVAVAAFAAVTPARAERAGIFDASVSGCGCHDYGPEQLPVSPTIVKMLVDGAPAESFTGFAPGKSYEVIVWVLGPVVPFAGFNLETNAGTLSAVDTAVKTVAHTECQHMERVTFPKCKASNPAPGQECRIERSAECPVFDITNGDCQPAHCKPTEPRFGDPNACSPCDAVEIIDVQATHSTPNPLPFFRMTWTAPSDGTSEVTFTLAGNSVEGVLGNPALDIWNFSDPYPIVLRAAP